MSRRKNKVKDVEHLEDKGINVEHKRAIKILAQTKEAHAKFNEGKKRVLVEVSKGVMVEKWV